MSVSLRHGMRLVCWITAGMAAFVVCDDEERKIVGLRIAAPHEFTAQVDTFAENLVKRLEAFSAENSDFSVAIPDSTGHFAQSPSHIINIKLTDVAIVGYDEYRKEMKRVDSIASAITDRIPMWFVAPVGLGSVGMQSTEKIQTAIWNIAYGATTQPSMKAHVEITKAGPDSIVWSIDEDIRGFSSTALQPSEQIDMLLSQLRGRLDETLPFFQLK